MIDFEQTIKCSEYSEMLTLRLHFGRSYDNNIFIKYNLILQSTKKARNAGFIDFQTILYNK